MELSRVLLMPPAVFTLYLLISAGISQFAKHIAARGVSSAEKESAYACGEDMPENQGQPDYSEFFMYAFFFTIVHVVALVVATDPNGLTITSAVYLGVTLLALFMLLRRKKDADS